MSQGIQIFNSSGNVDLDLSDGVFSILGVVTKVFPTTGTSGNIVTETTSNSNITRGTPCFFISKIPYIDGYGGDPFPAPVVVSFSSTSITWTITNNLYDLGGAVYGTLSFFYGYI